MGVIFDTGKFLELAPNARSGYRAATENGQEILDRYQITENGLRLCHFLAQILHESGGLSILFENLNYSAKRIPQVWPSRFLPKGPLLLKIMSIILKNWPMKFMEIGWAIQIRETDIDIEGEG